MYTTTNIILFILSFINFIFLIYAVRTEIRLKKFFRGGKAKSLEEVFNSLGEKVNELHKENVELKKYATSLDQKLQKSIRKVSVKRFNPFSDSGSDQSFAIALLNDDQDGVIISTLYSRERVSIFAKPIKAGTSTYEFSNEEKEVLENAKKM